MNKQYELNSKYGYNSFKKCWFYGADITKQGHPCTVVMFGDYKTEQEAINAHDNAVNHLKTDYSHLLNNSGVNNNA